MSDSSKRGYAVHRGQFDPTMLSEVFSFRERWRFKPEKEFKPSNVSMQHAIDSEQDGPFDVWAARAQLALADDGTRVAEREIRLRDAVLATPLDERNDARELFEFEHDDALVREVNGNDIASTFGPSSVPPLPAAFTEPSVWARVVVGAWRQEAAIHMLEVRTSLFSLEDAVLEQGLVDIDVGTAGDNYVEILAVESGRARVRTLNTACQHAAALQFVSGNRWPRRYVPTKDNFSDADSRLADAGLIAQGQRLRGAAVERHLERQRSLPDHP